MSVPENKGTEGSAGRRPGRKTNPPGAQRSAHEPQAMPVAGPVGEIRQEAGPAFRPSTRLRVRGLNVLSDAASRRVRCGLSREGESLHHARQVPGGADPVPLRSRNRWLVGRRP